MVKIIVGDYKPKNNEIIIDVYNDNIIFKNSQDDKPIVFYAEACGLDKSTIKMIIKRATRDITIVCASNKTISGIRQSKKCSIKKEYKNEILSPFEIATYIMGIKDREYLFEFLCTCRNQMYMITRTLVSNHCSFDRRNQNWIAYIDTIAWKCMPEIIFAIMAFKIKPELNSYGNPIHKYMKWRYPKKNEE